MLRAVRVDDATDFMAMWQDESFAQDAGIEASSGSILLDNEALRTVRNGRFPAIPPEAFTGQASRKFIVPIEYITSGS